MSYMKVYRAVIYFERGNLFFYVAKFLSLLTALSFYKVGWI